jgi:phenylacetate-CoA ligase
MAIPRKVSLYLFKFWSFVRGEGKLLPYLEWLLKTQYNREKLLKIQKERLSRMLKYAFTYVPYYKSLKININKRERNENPFSVLKEIPPLTKETLRRDPSVFLSLLYKNKKLYSRFTAGTTGIPLRVYYCKDSYLWRKALLLRHYFWINYKLGDRVAVLWGARTHFLLKNLLDYIEDFITNNRELRAYFISDKLLLEYGKYLEKFKPKLIESYPSLLVLLADVANNNNLKIRPSFIQSTSETLLPNQRRYIEDTFKAKVVDKYGANEVGPIAQECTFCGNYHINMENLVVEVENNEIILTTLTNYAMPLIRYKIGDIGKLNDEEENCDIKLITFKEIKGRKYDMIVTPSGKFIDPYFFVSLFKDFKEVKQFRVEQKKYSKIKIFVAARDNEEKLKESLMEKLLFLTKEEGMDIEIKFKKKIESDGKFFFVKSEPYSRISKKL